MRTWSATWTWLIGTTLVLQITLALGIIGAFGTIKHGTAVSRGYAGLLLTGFTFFALLHVWRRYRALARNVGANILMPVNNLIETADDRQSEVAKIGTSVVFAIGLIAMVVFGVKYSESEIYCWDAPQPIAKGFFHSRRVAFGGGGGCKDLLAMGQPGKEVTKDSAQIDNAWEYKLVLTDGMLLLAFGAALISGGLLLRDYRRDSA
jgi:hypothetical protein